MFTAIIATSIVFFVNFNKSQNTQPATAVISSEQPTADSDIKIFDDPNFNVSFAYPSGWEVFAIGDTITLTKSLGTKPNSQETSVAILKINIAQNSDNLNLTNYISSQVKLRKLKDYPKATFLELGRTNALEVTFPSKYGERVIAAFHSDKIYEFRWEPQTQQEEEAEVELKNKIIATFKFLD